MLSRGFWKFSKYIYLFRFLKSIQAKSPKSPYLWTMLYDALRLWVALAATQIPAQSFARGDSCISSHLIKSTQEKPK
ncbi:hypothetical protein F5Y09DRAFT_314635 [Xylaria sp. FL1042]|nr:hypothetical protein F5Y09DRAFT_314635 [Xylaria sp. FL1042]